MMLIDCATAIHIALCIVPPFQLSVAASVATDSVGRYTFR